MKFFESNFGYWLSRIIVIAIASWCGGTITGILLEFILNLFGFIAFAITATVISYFLFWFAMFGISPLIIRDSKAQLSRFILQTNIGVLLVIFTATAAVVSSVCSAIMLIGKVEQTFPDYSMLLWLIAIPFFGFIFFIATKMDNEVS